jgi:hypothetical protein
MIGLGKGRGMGSKEEKFKEKLCNRCAPLKRLLEKIIKSNEYVFGRGFDSPRLHQNFTL